MSDEKKTYSLRTSATIVVVLVGIIVAIVYSVAINKQEPADTEKEKLWAGKLENAFLVFDGVQSARVEGATILIDFAADKPTGVRKETALKAARTSADVRLKLKLDPKVTVLVSVKSKPVYQLVYAEPRGIVEEKVLETTISPATNAPAPGVQTAP